jgi:hypothetical protein
MSKCHADKKSAENPQVQFLWLMDLQTISQFTTYFIKVCSPGVTTTADLVIVHAGLFWLFGECAHAVSDERLKQDYNEESLSARANLETILARLPFHVPATLDYVYAMSMAVSLSHYEIQLNRWGGVLAVQPSDHNRPCTAFRERNYPQRGTLSALHRG